MAAAAFPFVRILAKALLIMRERLKLWLRSAAVLRSELLKQGLFRQQSRVVQAAYY